MSAPLIAAAISATLMPPFFALVPGGAALRSANRDLHSRILAGSARAHDPASRSR